MFLTGSQQNALLQSLLDMQSTSSQPIEPLDLLGAVVEQRLNVPSSISTKLPTTNSVGDVSSSKNSNGLLQAMQEKQTFPSNLENSTIVSMSKNSQKDLMIGSMTQNSQRNYSAGSQNSLRNSRGGSVTINPDTNPTVVSMSQSSQGNATIVSLPQNLQGNSTIVSMSQNHPGNNSAMISLPQDLQENSSIGSVTQNSQRISNVIGTLSHDPQVNSATVSVSQGNSTIGSLSQNPPQSGLSNTVGRVSASQENDLLTSLADWSVSMEMESQPSGIQQQLQQLLGNHHHHHGAHKDKSAKHHHASDKPPASQSITVQQVNTVGANFSGQNSSQNQPQTGQSLMGQFLISNNSANDTRSSQKDPIVQSSLQQLPGVQAPSQGAVSASHMKGADSQATVLSSNVQTSVQGSVPGISGLNVMKQQHQKILQQPAGMSNGSITVTPRGDLLKQVDGGQTAVSTDPVILLSPKLREMLAKINKQLAILKAIPNR